MDRDAWDMAWGAWAWDWDEAQLALFVCSAGGTSNFDRADWQSAERGRSCRGGVGVRVGVASPVTEISGSAGAGRKLYGHGYGARAAGVWRSERYGQQLPRVWGVAKPSLPQAWWQWWQGRSGECH
jgi:hypothetical protein